MIELNGIKINEDDFAKIAEKQGYEKKYEYPLVMRNTKNGDVWEFSDLFSGICLVAGDEGSYVGEKCDCLVEHTNSLWKPCERPAKLYDGLTSEQWQQVIDDKMIVQVRDATHATWVISDGLLEINFDNDYRFRTNMEQDWKHCRIHPSQPQFGGRADWVKDDDIIAYKTLNSDNIKVHTSVILTMGNIWEDVVRWQVVKL